LKSGNETIRRNADAIAALDSPSDGAAPVILPVKVVRRLVVDDGALKAIEIISGIAASLSKACYVS
jgi:hypothetical protein